jgi:hypothetical protein
MRKHINEMFEEIYTKINETNSLSYFFPLDNHTSKSLFEQHREFFIKSYTSVSTRYIQYEYRFKYFTYVPVIEFSNFTPDLKPPMYRLVDKNGNTLVSCNLGYPNCYGIPGLEAHLGKPFNIVKEKISSVISEVEIDTLDDSSFYFDPKDEHIMEIVATEPLKKGE